MKITYYYDIRNFTWNKEKNTFYGEAPHLECIMPDGNIHPEAFPNGKEQFFIQNFETGGFRRFRFVKEEIESFSFPLMVDGGYEEHNYDIKYWVFKSDDDIYCRINIGEVTEI